MIFILCGAAGLRIGEALGIEIDKHISPDFLTISVKQKVHHGRVEQRLKTANGVRQVDLHPAIAALLKEFVGDRKIGLPVLHSEGKAPVTNEHHPSPSASGPQGTELRQSVHRNAQSWKPCVPSLQEHVPAELCGMSRGPGVLVALCKSAQVSRLVPARCQALSLPRYSGLSARH